MVAVFFLATGTSVLNQVQDRRIDALMGRTKNRPIPAGEIKPASALFLSLFLLAAGILLFAESGMWIPLILGAGNVIIYNGIYTRLKMKTVFALIPGALTGAVPILIGWTAAGGNIIDPEAIFLGLFMFFWQVPHFWLLNLSYDLQYKTAEIPTITDHFTFFQVKRIIVVWLTAASLTSLMMVSRGFSHHIILAAAILLMNIILLIITIYRFFIAHSDPYKLLFILVNSFLFIVLILLIAEKLYLLT